MSKRVCCLYRVSTDKQVDYNSNHEADIPMQRKACHKFCDEKGWEIVHEEQEDGVSGHKVRAENRDKIQIIKDLAIKQKFDILLVFMFDRIGRIADETPFVVEWFVKNGIEVWSTQEGEQRFDNHIDKLLNYIRFWQADGESEKTSVRTRTSLGQLVESGHFKGGVAAFGYDLVKSGRFNKRKHELYDLQVNPDEAIVVKIIFDKYTQEGYGAHRITTWLNNNGYRARTGKMWHEATIRGILCNLTYTGVLRSGDSRSEVIPELQIISPEQFERARMIMKERSDKKKENPTVPLNTKGKSLLSGNIYCGHCGSRLTLTTSGKSRKRKDGTVDNTIRIRYACYGKSRKQTECNGQSGYTLHIINDLIDEIVRDIFRKMKGVSKNDVVRLRYADELEVRKARLNMVKADYSKEFENLNVLKSEVVKAIKGESSFSADTLSGLIAESETECDRLLSLCRDAEKEVNESENLLKELSDTYDEL
ncbi:MAG: recombinase family protein, partial [Clostridia bacterium]|nr:recombinase family protein [Clostridia bacterium]